MREQDREQFVSESDTATAVMEPEIKEFVEEKVIEQVTEESEVTSITVDTDEPNISSSIGTNNICQSYSPLIVSYHNPASTIAEQYRTLRTALLAQVSDEKFCYMITSADEGEGKTLTCLNLAFTLAEYKHKRVVVVDCNLRAGGLNKFLGVASSSKGFAELVKGEASFEEVLWTTTHPNLHVVSAGKAFSRDIPEIMGNEKLTDIIRQFQENYDFVLLDVPAVTKFSDASVIGQIVRESLLIVKMNSTHKKLIAQSIGLLQSLGVAIKGVVLTNHQRVDGGIVGRFF